MSNIELQASVCEAPVFLITFPFRLQMALTKAIEAGIAYLPDGGLIEFQVDGARECPCVAISFKVPGGWTAEFREAIAVLGVWQDFSRISSSIGCGD